MDSQAFQDAPGAPGIPPTWTSSAKDMVGCTLGNSHLWFTLGFGIVNEVYYPRIDIPQIRDLGFIVADGKGFWAEVKRVERYSVRLVEPGVPAVEIVHDHERYTLRLRIAPDQRPDREPGGAQSPHVRETTEIRSYNHYPRRRRILVHGVTSTS